MAFTFSGEVWIYSGEGSWFFVTLPLELADEIHARTAGMKRGFGSVRVIATIGTSTWATSLFRESQSGSYILPLKKEIRVKEKIANDDLVNVRLSLAYV